MAARITATPKIVLVPVGKTAGPTAIEWDTDSNNLGVVTDSINGAAPKPFDGGPNGQRRSNRPKTQEIGLNETHVFELRRTNAAKTLLASATVTAEKSVPVRIEVIGAIGTYMAKYNWAQAISNVSIWPGLHDVEFRFHTELPTVPVVELYRDAAQTSSVAAVFPIFGGLRTEHVLWIGDEPRLPQDTKLFFKIFAGTPPPYKSPPAVLRGSFITARQAVVVIFDRIFMRRDGDPNSKGEMVFTFGVGDADTRAPLFNFGPDGTPPHHREDLGDGQNLYPNRQLPVPNAPRRLWVEVRGEDNDEAFFSSTPADAPWMIPQASGAMTGSWAYDSGEGAWVWAELDTFAGGALTPGTREVPFSMATGNFGVAFEVHGRMRVTAHPQPALRMLSLRTEPGQIGSSAEARALVVSAGVGGNRGGVWMAALGLDGAVYAKAVAPGASSLGRNQWTRLGGAFTGWLTAVAADEEHLDLFALDGEGGVHHKSHGDGEAPDGDWRRLSGAFVGPLAATLGPRKVIELFGTDREGVVYHFTTEPGARESPRREWQSIGGTIAGPPAAVYSPRAGLGLFALAHDGEVLHKRRNGRGWEPAATQWDSLGGDFKGGALQARLLEDGSLLLVVLTPEKLLQTLTWKDYPKGRPDRRWTNMGTLDALMETLLPAPEEVPIPEPPRLCA